MPDSKGPGANMGSTWVLSAPDGPHVGPMNLATREIIEVCVIPSVPIAIPCSVFLGSQVATQVVKASAIIVTFLDAICRMIINIFIFRKQTNKQTNKQNNPPQKKREKKEKKNENKNKQKQNKTKKPNLIFLGNLCLQICYSCFSNVLSVTWWILYIPSKR